jgi:hypothetical protein
MLYYLFREETGILITKLAQGEEQKIHFSVCSGPIYVFNKAALKLKIFICSQGITNSGKMVQHNTRVGAAYG